MPDDIPPAPPLLPRRRRTSFSWSTLIVGASVLISGIIVYRRDGFARTLAIAEGDSWLFVTILPQMLAGSLIGSFFTMLLPREVVARVVGEESGWLGLIVAMLVGCFLPGGPYAIYPVTAAMLALGADVGCAITFVTAWTLLGYNRALVWELPFFGGHYLFWRIVVSIPVPIVTGLLGRYIARAFAHTRGAAS